MEIMIGSSVGEYGYSCFCEVWKFFTKYDINRLVGTNTFIEDKTIKDKQLLKIIDILGRKIKRTNQLCFISMMMEQWRRNNF